jgi:RNA polymerase sigma-70 factor (ECF subfamily)
MTDEGPLPADARLRASMVAYQAGSLDAFRAIYADIAPALRRYLLYLARHRDLAEDLVQETFLQMHRSRAAYNAAYPVAPWLFGLARYVFLMNRRAARRYAAVHDTATEPPDVPVPAEMDHLATTDTIRRAIAGLDADQSEPLLLHHVWGFTFDEIAGMLGISPAAARARSSRAMAEMRRRLAGPEERR